LTKKAYLLSRITGFLDPGADPFGSGWHILQFNYAVARGGLFGSGWGNCLWANSYLPLSYSDSSFAALAEALGFIGSAPVIVGFGLLAWFAFRISAVSHDPFKKLFISSMMFMIVIQALMHISVNTGMMPPTGITLPLFSYGGSSLLSTMIAAGMIISAAESPDQI
jgi:cell division protein FtsW